MFSSSRELIRQGRNSVYAEALIEKYGVEIMKVRFENGTLDDDCLRNLKKEMTGEMIKEFGISWFGKRKLEKKGKKKALSTLVDILYWAAVCKSGHFLQTGIQNDLCVDVSDGLIVVQGVGIGVRGSGTELAGSAAPSSSTRAKYLSNKMGRLVAIGIVNLLTEKTVEKVTNEDLRKVLGDVKTFMEAGNGGRERGDEGTGGGSSTTNGELVTEAGEAKEGVKDGICAICLQPDGESPKSFPCIQCRAAFHEECLLDWREMSNTCPICRRKF